MGNFNSVGAISVAIAKGKFDPNIRLTNMAMAYFQSLENRPAKSFFRFCRFRFLQQAITFSLKRIC